jgi:hypothetical protein
VVKQLLTPDQCEKLKAAAGELIDKWEPEKEYLWMLPNGETKERSSDQHLIDSSDSITFFMEDGAIDPHTGIVSFICSFLFIENFKKNRETQSWETSWREQNWSCTSYSPP